MIGFLMAHEKKENKHIKDYLQMTYRITNEYTNKQWSDSHTEDILRDAKQR